MGLFGDSWASGAAKTAANTAGSQANTLFGEGQGAQSLLMPFLRGELNSNSAFTPTQLNQMLTAAGAGAGGAASSLAGAASLQAARTGNSAANTGLLDSIARAKSQGLAKANENIASADVMQTEANKQSAAGGLQNLFGADTGNAMKAMGIQSQDIADQIKASSTGGWLGNFMNQFVGPLAGAFKNAGQGAQAFGLT